MRLKFQHGLSYREIAEVTGRSTGAVGVLVHEGMCALRRRLAGAAGVAAGIAAGSRGERRCPMSETMDSSASLTAYALGELDGAAKAAVESRLLTTRGPRHGGRDPLGERRAHRGPFERAGAGAASGAARGRGRARDAFPEALDRSDGARAVRRRRRRAGPRAGAAGTTCRSRTTGAAGAARTSDGRPTTADLRPRRGFAAARDHAGRVAGAAGTPRSFRPDHRGSRKRRFWRADALPVAAPLKEPVVKDDPSVITGSGGGGVGGGGGHARPGVLIAARP